MSVTQLSPDQQIVWDILTRDPASFAHAWGAALSQADSDTMHAQCDDLLLELMGFPTEDAVRIMKTFLCIYRLPLDVTRLKNFNVFHKKYGDYVLENGSNLRSYERH